MSALGSPVKKVFKLSTPPIMPLARCEPDFSSQVGQRSHVVYQVPLPQKAFARAWALVIRSER